MSRDKNEDAVKGFWNAAENDPREVGIQINFENKCYGK